MSAKLRKINRYVISFQDIFCRLHASPTIEKRPTSYWGLYNKCDSGLNQMLHQGRLLKAKDAHPAKKRLIMQESMECFIFQNVILFFLTEAIEDKPKEHRIFARRFKTEDLQT